MPHNPDVPCADCGKLLWSSPTSLPAGQRRCLACRRAAKGVTTRVTHYDCRSCGERVERPVTRGTSPTWCPSCRASGKRPRACIVCGTFGVHNGCRACSRICGSFLRTGRWPSSHVPASHPSRSSKIPDDHPARWIVTLAWPVWYGDCDECGQVFSSNTPVKVYCSKLCAKRVGKRARRGRENGEADSFRWTQVVALFLAFDRCCAYCWEPIEGQPDPDHVIPLSRGGHNTISNILPACRPCNTDKRNLAPDEWAADRAARGKPPRVTAWQNDSRYHHLALRTARPQAA